MSKERVPFEESLVCFEPHWYQGGRNNEEAFASGCGQKHFHVGTKNYERLAQARGSPRIIPPNPSGCFRAQSTCRILLCHSCSVRKTKENKLWERKENILICTHQFVESRGRELREWREKKAKGKLGARDPKSPPTGPLHSSYWEERVCAFTVFIDESQKINNLTGSTYRSVKMLYRQATIPVTGTPCHNK